MVVIRHNEGGEGGTTDRKADTGQLGKYLLRYVPGILTNT